MRQILLRHGGFVLFNDFVLEGLRVSLLYFFFREFYVLLEFNLVMTAIARALRPAVDPLSEALTVELQAFRLSARALGHDFHWALLRVFWF